MTFLSVVRKVLVCAAFMGVLAIFFRVNASGVRLGLGIIRQVTTVNGDGILGDRSGLRKRPDTTRCEWESS